MVGLGTRGRPPFRQVLTHGFIVAEDGRKMSKSLGNSIEPQDIIKQSGADILRLWVSMSDYTQEVRLSKEILSRVEAYRKIRNTMRYCWGTWRLRSGRGPRAGRPARGSGSHAARYGDGAADPPAYDEYEYGTIPRLNSFTTVDELVLQRRVERSDVYAGAAVA
jgi:isoleucyl-tRNA synthetase